MDEQTFHEVQQWLVKADHDLRSAKKLMTADDNEDALLDTAVYHCQQAAEKAFKAYLTANEIVFPKIHLLSPLLELCKDVDGSFVELADAAELLTPFATEFRYPGDILEPDPSDAEEAYRDAKNVIQFVNYRLDL
ncbi:MAG: HEPN domain-containing protein [Desulfobulbaceae bacterium]|nr:HEPN domain-containing protein [Desulfobulbaceae bacterium]